MRGTRNKVTLGTLLVGVLLTAFSFIAFMPSVSAAQEFKWVDSSTIRATDLTVGNVTGTFDFIDNQPTDTNFEYTVPNSVSTCKKPKLIVNGDNRAQASLFTYITFGGGIVPIGCNETETVITIGDVQNATKGIEPVGDSDYRQVTYTWADQNTIKATGTLTADFVINGGRYFRTNDPTNAPGCRDSIVVGAGDTAQGTLRIAEPNRGACNEATRNITIANTAASPGGAKGDADADPETSCTLAIGTSIGGKGIGWIVCAVNDGIFKAVSLLDDLINSNLQPDLTIFDKAGNGSSYHSAWNSFRVIALGFVVIAALIMVIAQAMGLDIFDAYTVRKVLPRLLLAAVFITLSWDVLEIFYRLSDAATIGLRSLIYAPFSTLDAIQLGGGSIFSGVLLGGGALIALGWIALLSFALSALIAVVLAFFILILIKVALAGMLIASPIFIAAAILPGTQKLYEFGKGTLISLLLAPVVVGALIALFRVGAVIAYNRADGNAAVNQIIAILLYFGAYAAILKGLSMVGGFAATITGFVSDRGKGLSDGLKKYRSNTRKQRGQKMASGSLFKGNNFAAKSFNWASRRTAQVPQAGLGILPGSRRKHRGLDDLRTRAAGERAMKSEMMQQLQYDDDGSAALFLSGGKSANRARRELKRLNPTWSDDRVNQAVSTAEAVGINRENAVAAGTLVARNKARSMGSGQALIDAVHGTSQYIGGRGSTTAKNIEEGIQYHLRTNGRTDGAANSMDAAWGRASMGENAQAAAAATQAHLAHMSQQYRFGNESAHEANIRALNPGLAAPQVTAEVNRRVAIDRRNAAVAVNQQRARNNQTALSGPALNQAVNQMIVDQNHQGAVKLLEAHTILAQGTSGENQQAINAELHALGYDMNMRSTTQAEDYLASHASTTVGPNFNGQALRTEARTWDGQGDPSQGQGRGAAPAAVPATGGLPPPPPPGTGGP